jgi:uncharacterized peroxidase-related enzyme
LLRLIKDEVLVKQLEIDWKQADLNEKQFAMLQYAEKLTLTPGKMVKGDVDSLLEVGFSERDILDINQIVCYFAYVNRLADGLGVPLEGFWNED